MTAPADGKKEKEGKKEEKEEKEKEKNDTWKNEKRKNVKRKKRKKKKKKKGKKEKRASQACGDALRRQVAAAEMAALAAAQSFQTQVERLARASVPPQLCVEFYVSQFENG